MCLRPLHGLSIGTGRVCSSMKCLLDDSYGYVSSPSVRRDNDHHHDVYFDRRGDGKGYQRDGRGGI